MIKLSGSVQIREIKGRNGPFMVGNLLTEIGEFAVKRGIEEFDPGSYEGEFTISKIYPASFHAGGRSIFEVRADVEAIALTDVDTSTQSSPEPSKWKGRKRFEKLFYERTIGTLQFGGVLVLIVPHYAINQAFAIWISRHCSDIRVFRAATGRFKQVIVLAKRKRASGSVDSVTRDLLIKIGVGDVGAGLRVSALLPSIITPMV